MRSDSPDAIRSLTRDDFAVLTPVTTRWSDNDMYGHLNNAVYYELFDAAINAWLGNQAELSFTSTPVIGVVAESGCRFFAETAFPGELTVAFRVAHIGSSSVVYELGVFDSAEPSEDALSTAAGRWVHVYIDRARHISVPIPGALRAALEGVAG